jgi:HTH-type transcriptional regulator/antitoxin HipB
MQKGSPLFLNIGEGMHELENESLYGKVSTVKDLGQRIRMKRKILGFTLKHVAGLSGIGERYLSEFERGKATIEMGKALSVVNCLGLELVVKPKSGLK